MTETKYPLSGHYSGQKVVTLFGLKQQNDLNYLGCYGIDSDEAKRREESQRGLNKQETDQDVSIVFLTKKDHEVTTLLYLHEAYFLAHALGCLSIMNDLDEGRVMSLQDCWISFQKHHKNFAREYAVFYYFRSRGWVVKQGVNYGVNFLLYKTSPESVHAEYGVLICELNQTFQSLLTYHRVLQSVKKDLLLVFLSSNDPSFNFDSLRPNKLNEITITTKLFKTHPNFLPRVHLPAGVRESLDSWNL